MSGEEHIGLSHRFTKANVDHISRCNERPDMECRMYHYLDMESVRKARPPDSAFDYSAVGALFDTLSLTSPGVLARAALRSALMILSRS